VICGTVNKRIHSYFSLTNNRRNQIKKRILFGMLFFALFSISCSDNATEPNDNLSFSIAMDNTLPKIANSDIVLTNVKILIRDLKLKALSGEDTSNVRTGVFVATLNMDGTVTEIALSDLPVGNYESSKFEIHKLEPTETPPDPDFAEDSSRYSVIVEGTYLENEFIYKSKKPAHQHVKFDEPIELVDGGVLNITLVVNPNEWFVKNGETLDPTDIKNEHVIDNLIKDSFNRAFKDQNLDGQPD